MGLSLSRSLCQPSIAHKRSWRGRVLAPRRLCLGRECLSGRPLAPSWCCSAAGLERGPLFAGHVPARTSQQEVAANVRRAPGTGSALPYNHHKCQGGKGEGWEGHQQAGCFLWLPVQTATAAPAAAPSYPLPPQLWGRPASQPASLSACRRPPGPHLSHQSFPFSSGYAGEAAATRRHRGQAAGTEKSLGTGTKRQPPSQAHVSGS